MSLENLKEGVILSESILRGTSKAPPLTESDEKILSAVLENHWSDMRKLIELLYREKRKSDPCFLLLKEIRDRGMVPFDRISKVVAEVEGAV
jgi:NurA-like 5'-3' nuclease